MIVLNGQPWEVREGTVVAEVVTALVGDGAGRGVAVALNGEVVPRAEWPAVVVASGDRVEVLTASQGG